VLRPTKEGFYRRNSQPSCFPPNVVYWMRDRRVLPAAFVLDLLRMFLILSFFRSAFRSSRNCTIVRRSPVLSVRVARSWMYTIAAFSDTYPLNQ
jgi:hypothetical protein